MLFAVALALWKWNGSARLCVGVWERGENMIIIITVIMVACHNHWPSLSLFGAHSRAPKEGLAISQAD